MIYKNNCNKDNEHVQVYLIFCFIGRKDNFVRRWLLYNVVKSYYATERLASIRINMFL
jgi:hypothetical protein